MAKALVGTGSNEEQVQFDLRAHLSKYNVPNRVLSLLKQDSITENELSSFRIKDLDNWCDENQLKAIEKMRFLNAVKSLPNSQANTPDNEPKIVPILIGNEEKEQLSQFDDMKNNVKNMMNHINKLQNTSNVDEVIKGINNVCDEIQSYVETLRKNLLNQVKSIQSTKSQNFSSSNKTFENLLKMIENTNDKYKKYLTSINNNNNNTQQVVLTKDEIQQEISNCEQEYDKIVSNNDKIMSQNNNIVSLNCSMSDIKQIFENKLIQIKTTKCNDQFKFIQKMANIKFSQHKDDSQSYSICQFDLKYTKLNKGSTIDCDNKHIKIGSEDGICYGMILPDAKNVQGYSGGQHCFRIYYKNPAGPNKWLFFGIYKYGIKPEDEDTYEHETSWGIADYGGGSIYCNGKVEWDKSNMSFLYSLDENQIDMLIDFDNGILSYSIVDDNVENRKYTFKKKFNANIFSFLSKQVYYTVHLNFFNSQTQVQIAKIGVDMFGKNKKLVQWPISKY